MDDPDFFSATIGIIGGKGRMGGWLARALEKAGQKVFIADAKDGEVSHEFVRRHRVLILAVPISRVGEVMQRIGPRTLQDGVVMDICSLKQGPMASMLEHAQGEVVGLHPMFGPSAKGFKGQTVFMSQGRGDRWHKWMSRFLKEQQAKVVEIEPKKHDQLMAQVQSLRHLWLLCLGQALEDLGYDPASELDISGPWFKTLLAMLGHQCEQPGELYTELAMNNPEVGPAAEALQRAATNTLGCLENGDAEGLKRLFSQVESKFLGVSDDISLD